MTAAELDTDRATRAEQRIAAAAARHRELITAAADELALRDAAIVAAVDAGDLSERKAAKAAGLSPSGVRDVIARAG
jgi:DNA-directed RNA polymerase specialized sigma24 family protein